MRTTTAPLHMAKARPRLMSFFTGNARRVFLTKFVLWVLGLVITTRTLWPTLSVPVQADDMLTLFNIGPSYKGSLVREMLFESGNAIRMFHNGETAHLVPVGLPAEVALKRLMLRADSIHLTAAGVHHAAMLVLNLGTFVASVLLVFRIRRRTHSSALGTSVYAVPVALGFAASLQVTTLWSTYDPVVVHPIFGALVTLVGVSYLAVLVGIVQRDSGLRSKVLCASLGVFGVLVYEGFYPFVAIATFMVVFRFVQRRMYERGGSIDAASVLAVAPALALIIGSKLYSQSIGSPVYQGTALRISLNSVSAWSTSLHTTSPGGSWGRDISTLHAAPTGWDTSRMLSGAAVACFLVVWVLVARYVDRSSLVLSKTTQRASLCEMLLPIVSMIVLCPGIFALSVQWSAYLVYPGYTYMEATSSYWAWSMLVGIGLQHVLSRNRSTLLALTLVGFALVWSGVQADFNDAAVRAEVASPTPFGFDLVRMLDHGTSLNEGGRCRLLEMVTSMSGNQPWRDSLNSLYLDRHGQVFCSD